MKKTHWYHIGTCLAFVHPWIIHACQLTYHWQPLNLPNPSLPLNKQLFALSAATSAFPTSLLDVDLDTNHRWSWGNEWMGVGNAQKSHSPWTHVLETHQGQPMNRALSGYMLCTLQFPSGTGLSIRHVKPSMGSSPWVQYLNMKAQHFTTRLQKWSN